MIEAGAVSLRHVSLFHGQTQRDLEALASEIVVRRYDRNEMIFAQGDRGDGLYIVVAGQVSIGRYNADGDELILALYEAGDYFGDLALIDEDPRSANATAIEDSVLYFLSRTAFQSFLAGHPEALLGCLQAVVRQFRRLTDIADEIALMDVRKRLARRLLRLTGDTEPTRETIRITQQQLANMLGATRENVNKHLNMLVDTQAISLERGRIQIIDREQLQDVADGAL